MNSSYVLTTNLLGWRHAIPSTREAFREARRANDCLLASLAVEEAFAILVANYVALEKAMASANIEHMVERGVALSGLNRRRREIDRHLVNLLASGEMFTEHVRRRMKKEYGRDSQELKNLEDALADQRGRLLGFHATECLRNAVLHNSLPITSWTMNSKWVNRGEFSGPNGGELGPSARLEYSVSFAFDPKLLALDRKIDPALISQLNDRASKDGKVSWLPITREYIEALSMVLGQVRATCGQHECEAIELLTGLSNDYREALPNGSDQPHHVFVVHRGEKGAWLDNVALTLGLSDQINELRNEHRPMVNLHRRALKS